MLVLIIVVTILAWLRGWQLWSLIPLAVAFVWGYLGGWFSTQLIQIICLGAVVWMWGISPPPAEMIDNWHAWVEEQKEQWNKTTGRKPTQPPSANEE